MATPTLDEQMELAKTYCPDMLAYLKRMERWVGSGHRGGEATVIKEARRGGPPEWLRLAREEIMTELLEESALFRALLGVEENQ